MTRERVSMPNVSDMFPVESTPAVPGPNDTQALRALTPTGYALSALVVADDPAVLESVRSVAPRTVTVVHSPRVGKIAAKLADFQPNVLVYESTDSAEVASLVSQVDRNHPTVSVIVVGKREDGPHLMRLAASGAICRFLLLPLAAGQTRLALLAALRQHVTLVNSRAATAPATTRPDKKRMWIIAASALAVIVIAAAAFVGFRRSQPSSRSVAVGVSPPVATPLQAQLQRARDAFDQARLLKPQGDNALEIYRSVLALDSTNTEALRGVRQIADKILESAEASLTREDLEAAVRDIETARDIDASHPRLAFFDTQIARERERRKLAQMQDVSGQVRRLLSLATERMQAGRLIAPAGASAGDALLEARRLDPTNPEVALGVRELTGALVERGRKALGERDLRGAQQLAQAAAGLGSASASVAALERAIADVARQLAARETPAPLPQNAPAAASNANIDALAADVRQRLNEGKLLEPQGGTARDALIALRNAAPNRPETNELARSLATVALVTSKQAISGKKYELAAQLLALARDGGARDDTEAIAAAERELNAARERDDALPAITQAIKLPRTREVQPVYPKDAAKFGDEGWVEMEFTISPTGKPENIKVTNARPRRVFEQAAMTALSQWRYEPIVRNGEPVAQRARLTMTFKLK
jgi:TonB family protein